MRPLAVVTGASSGIGYELAKVFAQNGYDLLIVAQSDRLMKAQADFQSLGGEVISVQVDLASADGIDTLCEKLEKLNRPVNVLAINAGVGVGGEFLLNDLHDELNMVKLNVLYPLSLTKFVLKGMAERGEGKIIFTSSIAADMPGPYYAVYAATKAFLQSFAEALRVEVKDNGITVTALQPGATRTDFFDRAEIHESQESLDKMDDPAKVAQDGFDALMAGKDHVVAGSFKNKIQSTMGKILPESVGAKMQGAQIKESVKHH